MATTRAQSLLELASRAGQECKRLHSELGVVEALETREKENLVAAVKALETAVEQCAVIDDTALSLDTTCSSSKIASDIAAAGQELKAALPGGADEGVYVAGAGRAGCSQSGVPGGASGGSGNVKYTDAQELTDPQTMQARDNIGAADAATLTGLVGNVGNTEADFATAFEMAFAGE